MVKQLHFFLQTFTLVLEMLEEVQGLQTTTHRQRRGKRLI